MSLQEIPTKHDLDPQEAEKNATLCQYKKKLAVRLLTFIPGKTLYNARPWTTEHFYQCGRLIAQFMVALKVYLMITYWRSRVKICSSILTYNFNKKCFFY